MLSIVKCSALRSLSQLRRICGSDCAKFDYSSIKRFSASVRLRNEFLAERVDTRSLVKLSGEDAPNFLQGLITNDIRLFENSQQDMLIYCMLLNTQGRVLYDLLVYRVSKFFEKDKSVILECDSRASDDVIKTLSRYKLRRKAVSFFKLEEYRVWSAFPKSNLLANTDSKLPVSDSKNILFHSLDPRIPSFGHRLILPTEIKGSEVISNSTDAEEQYHSRRFDFGLSEGIQEHIPGQSFPLECNLFFLNGVSFSKGCYVGQELTTRTHHTGVIRKRIMPIFSRSPIAMDTSKGEGHVIVCEAKEKECGKVLAWRSCRGLALLRLQEALLSPGPLLIKDARGTILGRVETLVPNWWPADADEVIKKVRSKQERL